MIMVLTVLCCGGPSTELPVRLVLFKHDTDGLIVKWVIISESLLLYVFGSF